MSEAANTVRTEFSSPPIVPIPRVGNLADIIERNAREVPDRVAYSRLVGGEWTDVTAGQFREEVVGLAKGLVAAGVRPGDRVALMCRTRYEWTLFDFAIWYVGAVVVPIFPTSSQKQIEWLLDNSGATAIIVETEAQAAAIRASNSGPRGLRHVWAIDADCVGELTVDGTPVGDDEIKARRGAVTADSLATIVYTSGATGHPKGCMLTHGNFLFAVGTEVAMFPELFGPDERTLLFLPLAHIFARVVEVGCAVGRTRMGHSASISNLRDDLQEFQPTFLLTVPRVLENIFNNASQEAQAEGKGRAFNAAADTAIDYSRALEDGHTGVLVRARHSLFDRLVLSKIRATLGGAVKCVITGGAPLGERLGHFFRGCGLTVIEGYGLTETTAASTVNRIDAVRIGTVGQPIPGTAVRIADDGEVLIRGAHVFAGYWADPDRTHEVLDSLGWFHSGDVGDLDLDGFLTISGRKKEILVTAGGKNVAPAPLEDLIRAHPLVSQCMVVGNGQPYVAALITLDWQAVATWAAQHGKPSRVRDRATDPELLAEIQAAVDAANETVSPAESIRKFRVLPVDWTEADGHLTPTLKLRRAAVIRAFSDEIERLYA